MGKRPITILDCFNNMVPALPMVAVGIKGRGRMRLTWHPYQLC